MIHFARMTGNERDVLIAALTEYDASQAARKRNTRLQRVHDDVRWRRYIVAELLDRIAGERGYNRG